MSARINTILIIGATSGIGEAMARRFHSMGKKVVAAGISQDKLAQLAQELPGLETRTVGIIDAPKRGTTDNSASLSHTQWDVTDLANLQSHVKGILADFPNLDTVFINAGIQNHYTILQPPDTAEVVREVTTNLIAPNLIAQSFAPHLLALAQSGTKTTLFLTSSSLAYFPLAFYPTYCATKAGISAFAKIVRMQLASTGCKDMSVVEVVPPVRLRAFSFFTTHQGFRSSHPLRFVKKKLYLFLLQSLQFNMTPKRSVSLSKKGKQKKGGGALTPPYTPPQYGDPPAARHPPRPDRRPAMPAARRRPSRPCRSRRTWRGFFAALERTARRKRELGARGVEVWRGTLYEAMGLAI